MDPQMIEILLPSMLRDDPDLKNILKKSIMIHEFRTFLATLALSHEGYEELDKATKDILARLAKKEDASEELKTLRKLLNCDFDIVKKLYRVFNAEFGVEVVGGTAWMNASNQFHNDTIDKNGRMFPAFISDGGVKEWRINNLLFSQVYNGITYPHTIINDVSKKYKVGDYNIVIDKNGDFTVMCNEDGRISMVQGCANGKIIVYEDDCLNTLTAQLDCGREFVVIS